MQLFQGIAQRGGQGRPGLALVNEKTNLTPIEHNGSPGLVAKPVSLSLLGMLGKPGGSSSLIGTMIWVENLAAVRLFSLGDSMTAARHSLNRW